MFSFGYKSSFSSLVRAAAAIGIGLVMVFGADRNAPILIVKLIAALIIIAGLALLFHALTKYRRHGNQDIRSAEELSRGESPQAVSRMRTLMVCNAAIVLVVGVLLLLYPKVLAGFVVTLIAIGLIALGAVQLFMMTSIMSLLGAGFSSLILSIICIVGGAFLLFSPFGERTMGIIAGCIMIVYGVSEIVSTFQYAKVRKISTQDAGRPSGPVAGDGGVPEAKEVDFVKVDPPQEGWGSGRVDDQTADE